ncbi:acyltransferase [Rhizobium sp. 21-4511-3d]
MTSLAIVFQVILMALPWGIRRFLLNRVFGFQIHKRARIGYSILLPRKLIMAEDSWIGHLNFAKGLEEIRLDDSARITHMNWISGFPLGGERYFKKFPNRYPQLHLNRHAGITNRNLIECTDRLVLGAYSFIGGNRCQILTHNIDFATLTQSCAPIVIGEHCFIATGCILLKGCALPDCCVVSAGSVLSKAYKEPYKLLSGVPAVPVRDLSPKLPFFHNISGQTDLTKEEREQVRLRQQAASMRYDASKAE